jgi:hypothetical protein
MEDIIIPQSSTWNIEESIQTDTGETLLVLLEKLLIQNIGKVFFGYFKKLTLTRDHPLRREIFRPRSYLDFCNLCKSKADHWKSRDKCIIKKSLDNITLLTCRRRWRITLLTFMLES